MRATALSLLFFFVIVSAIAQEPGDEVQLFFKGQKTPVEAFYQDYKFSSNKFVLQMNDKTKRIHVKKLDSLYLKNDTIIIQKINDRLFPLRLIERGTINVYDYQEKRLFIQKDNQETYPLPPNQLGKYFAYYTMQNKPDEYPDLSRDEFIEKVRAYNHSAVLGPTAMYDSLRTLAPRFVMRLGVYMPTIGFEIGITERITFANNISANFFGPTFRDAQTFVNFHSWHQLRYFIGYHKRLENGKSNYKYSGLFTAPTFQYMIDIGRTPLAVYGWSVGWQGDIMFNKAASTFHVGLGYEPTSPAIYIMTGVAFGLAF